MYDCNNIKVSAAKMMTDSEATIDSNVLAALSKSQDVNKKAVELRKKIQIQEDRLIGFSGNITKASYMYKEDNLTCKERVTYKFDIIKALYSVAFYVEEPLRHELLNFESKYLIGKNNCSKDLKYKEQLEKLTERTITALGENIQKDRDKLKSLRLSVFYTNYD